LVARFVVSGVRRHPGRSSLMSETPRWLTTAEAAAYLNVSIKQLSRWRQAELITPSKPSGDYGRNFYAPADLDALMESAKG
jgi:hypothetical protein